MPRIFKLLIVIVLALTLIVIVGSLWRYPAWLENPTWWLQLPIEAFVPVVATSAALVAFIWYLHDLTGKKREQPTPFAPSLAPLPPSSSILPTSELTLPLSSAPPTQIPTAPHVLPAPPGDFTGRADEIEKLTQELAGGASVAISGLAGMGGIGKTALALYVANQLKPQYPDAQILLEMKSASRDPLLPTEAMTQVIHSFDATADLRQATPEQIHALYLSILSDKRALLLFDNAADAAQVKPLVPPTGCAMLVTSRRHFALPGTNTLRLDLLPEPDARQLLLTICPRIGERADELARVCGRLPLALRIAASTLAERRDLSVDEYAARLADRRTRMAQLKLESDPELDLQAAFGYSYELLDDDTRARWRALAVFPAPFDRTAAMSVWALDVQATRKLLGDLVRYSLLDYDEAGERYSLHDLLADFANARLSAAERATAQLRHARHYVRVAGVANQAYLKGGKNVLLGLGLFDSEWLHIKAGQAWAASAAESSEDAVRLCNEYPDAASYCLTLRLLARDRIKWLESAFAAAHKLNEKQAKGAHLGNLGIAYANLGETRRAIKYFEQALTIDREIGDRRGETTDFGNLGNAYTNLGEARRAIEYHEHALAIDREIGDRRGEGNQLGNLGNAYRDLGETRRAIEYHERALAIDREIGDQGGEAAGFGNLGNDYADLGETRRAIEYYDQALAIARKTGDRRGEGNHLGNLGLAYANLGETRRAIEYYEQALVIAREIGDRRGEGNQLGNLGNAYRNLGETRRAIEYHEQALTIARETSDRRGEGNQLGNLGNTYASLGETRRAIEYYEQAQAVFHAIEDKVNEVKTARLLEELWKKNSP